MKFNVIINSPLIPSKLVLNSQEKTVLRKVKNTFFISHTTDMIQRTKCFFQNVNIGTPLKNIIRVENLCKNR